MTYTTKRRLLNILAYVGIFLSGYCVGNGYRYLQVFFEFGDTADAVTGGLRMVLGIAGILVGIWCVFRPKKEVWDAYTQDGTPTGGELVRGEPIPEGLYHLVSDVLLYHTDGDILLMKRDPNKPNYGGYFEATAGGSALKGETAEECAWRELYEETGIDCDTFHPIGSCAIKDTIYHMFTGITNVDKSDVVLQPGETVDYKWITKEEFKAFLCSDEMIPAQRERYAILMRNTDTATDEP